MAAQYFIGSWEILTGKLFENKLSIDCLKGVQFKLTENGDVIWSNASEEALQTPICKCDTYEAFSTATNVFNLRLGAYNGHVIEFRADHTDWNNHTVVLVSENWCFFVCKQITVDLCSTYADTPFSLLPALEDGYFSDLIIVAENKKQFHVHKCILQLIGDDIDWNSDPPPFSGLSEPVLNTILYWLYTECLPNNLLEITAQKVVAAVINYQSLSDLIQSCQSYLKIIALRNQIIGLVDDMHACCIQIIEYFNPKNNSQLSTSDNLISNPAKLCYVIKQSTREAALAGAKLLQLCDLYNKRKDELSRQERHEIIRYAKSHLPIFMSQLHSFLQVVKQTFNSMSVAQKQELATYLIPEIETGLDTLVNIYQVLKIAMDKIVNLEEIHGFESRRTPSLQTIFFKQEMYKFRYVQEQVSCILEGLFHKRESFQDMPVNQKIRLVSKSLEQLIEELPIFLLRLEEVIAALDEKLEWREFKFCFNVGISKVAIVLNKILNNRDDLQEVLLKLCEIVQRDTFTQSLVALGLINSTQCSGYSEENNSIQSNDLTNSTNINDHQLNLVESLCTPRSARKSTISKKALELLRSSCDADMHFELFYSIADNERGGFSDNDIFTELNSKRSCTQVVDDTHFQQIDSKTTKNKLISRTNSGNVIESPTDSLSGDNTTEVATINAHRVIVAARCDWFRRALLSGMREAIDKKITIYDSNLYLFQIFLVYLYSGELQPSPDHLGKEQLTDLILLSDRYELDLLKLDCEQALIKQYIDDDSVLYFLSMADQFNAKQLKSACTSYITQHPSVLSSELFNELPIELQDELYESATWARPTSSSNIHRPLNNSSTENLFSSTSHCLQHQQHNLTGLEDTTAELHVNNTDENKDTDELPLTHDSARLELCLAQLRDIVGDQAERDKLIQFALAADCDVNRAANFYYSSS